MMGISAHADGGIIGNVASGGNWSEAAYESLPQDISSDVSDNGGNGKGNGQIVVNVNVTPQFDISETNDNNIMKMIKAHLTELADDLGAEISAALSESFENMPA